MTNSFITPFILLLVSVFAAQVSENKLANAGTFLPAGVGSNLKLASLPVDIFDSAPTWGRHWHQGTFCNRPGIYCIRRLEDEGGGPADLVIDESSGTTTAALSGTLIRITTVSTCSNISAETMSMFESGTVEIVQNQLPPDWLNPLLASVGLSSPAEIVTITPGEQSYQVINTTNSNGEAVKIIQSVDRTKITINGIQYKLLIVNTSGSGEGIPRAVEY